MNDLSKLFQDLANSRPRHASEAVEQHLLSEFRRHHRRGTAWIYLARAAAVAIVGLALSSIFLHRSSRANHLPGSERSAQMNASGLDGFVLLPYAQSGVPLGEAVVIRVQLRPSDLTALGVPVIPSETGQRIGADVLIGQDGMPRGVRFIQ